MSCYQVKNLPNESEIDQLRKELSLARSERDQLQKELSLARSERDQLRKELSLARSERDQLRKELSSARSEKDQLRKELSLARCDASYYKTLHRRNVAIRERLHDQHDLEITQLKQQHRVEVDNLKKIIDELEAKVKLRERQLFGKKSERGTASPESIKKKEQRNRGQQWGVRSPPKRHYSDLPVRPEIKEIPESERLCPCCHAPYVDMGITEDSDVVEVEVKAHIRRMKRKKYKRTCRCLSQPLILTAPSGSKVLSKSHLGNSVWVSFLMKKFWHGQPLHRTIQELRSHHVSIPAGTIQWGFLRLLPLFRSIYTKIVEKSLRDKHWNADETGWKVFEALEGKANHQWFLWIFRSQSAAVFVLDPSRAASVVEDFFGEESRGIISCDRYRAYFCFVSKSEKRFLIAYCWAHVRRDFLAVAKDWPLYESWGMDWVEEIRHLYHLNDLRTAEVKGSQKFSECQKSLRKAIAAFKRKVKKQLADENIADPCRKVLESLKRHWHGLVTFLKHPKVPMDNNSAERNLRGSVVGRKNYYGSGSLKSAEFTAMMFTIIQTLVIWGINPQEWFSRFFDFIGSKWDKPIDDWLPWNMSLQQRIELSLNQHDPPK